MTEPGPALAVRDGQVELAFAFGDLVAYHGRGSIGGLALGFKALERGLPLLAHGAVPSRRDITVETAFDGPGSRDAFEMVTRAVTGGRYALVPGIAPSGAPEAPQGRFVFRLAHEATAVLLVLRAGLVGDDFTALVRRGAATPAEEQLLVDMKEDLATRLLALPPDRVYHATVEAG